MFMYGLDKTSKNNRMNGPVVSQIFPIIINEEQIKTMVKENVL